MQPDLPDTVDEQLPLKETVSLSTPAALVTAANTLTRQTEIGNTVHINCGILALVIVFSFT